VSNFSNGLSVQCARIFCDACVCRAQINVYLLTYLLNSETQRSSKDSRVVID